MPKPRRQLLSTDPWPDGYGRLVLAEVDSTNDEAARRAGDLAGPTWILGLHQTKGRGRRGRPWVDPTRNFSATLVMRPDEAPDKVALRSFVASLSLFDACVAATGRAEPFGLKWPNDVLLNGGKLAGILLESAGVGGQFSQIAIGIGVNLRSVPEVEPGSVPPVSLLSETGADVTAEDFLDLLAPAYARWEHQFTTYGFAPIREAWLNRAARLGEPLTARMTDTEVTGTFETVDEAGNLILKTNTGRQAIAAADVFF